MRIATASVRTGFAMTGGFTRGTVEAGKKQNRPRLPPRTMLCTAIPPCFAARSRETASRSAATLLRCHGRPRSDLKPPCDPRPDGSGAMFPHPFRARFHLLRLSLAA